MSIVIPTRDSGVRVHCAIESVLAQGDSGIEIVVVDDGSQEPIRLSDLEVEGGVRVLRTSGLGVSQARNLGIETSTGDWVSFLDDDDCLLPNWAETMRGLAAEEAGLVSVSAVFVDQQGSKRKNVEPRPLPGQLSDGRALFLAGCFSVRRRVLEISGGYDPVLTFSENTDLGLRVADALSSLGLVARSSGDVAIRIERRPAGHRRATASDLYRSAVRMLEKHELRLRHGRHLRADYHAVAGANAAKLGLLGAAQSHFRASLRLRPLRASAWLRVAAIESPWLSRRIWRTSGRSERDH